MRRPVLTGLVASVTEMAAPSQRPKLLYGIWSGYVLSTVFTLLAVALAACGVMTWRWTYLVLFVGKMVTNSLAWLALTRERAILPTQALNTMADVVVLTVAIYLTGGPSSPALAMYVIVVSVLALLANVGVTILMVLFILICFSGMMLLMVTGVLPPQPVLGAQSEVPSIGYALSSIAL